jgi:predicted transcriptional regulator
MELTPHQQFLKEAEARRKTIMRMVKKGKRQVDIAREVGLTRERIRQIVTAERAKEARRSGGVAKEAETPQAASSLVGGA